MNDSQRQGIRAILAEACALADEFVDTGFEPEEADLLAGSAYGFVYKSDKRARLSVVDDKRLDVKALDGVEAMTARWSAWPQHKFVPDLDISGVLPDKSPPDWRARIQTIQEDCKRLRRWIEGNL